MATTTLVGTYAIVIGILRAAHVTMAIVSSSSGTTHRTTSPVSAVTSTDSDDAYHTFNVSASYRTTEPAVTVGASAAVAASAVRSPITDSDLQCLSELPVDKLLRIRKTLRYVSHMLDDGDFREPQHSFPSGQQQRRIGPVMTTATAAARRYMGGDGYAFEVHQRADGAQASPLMMDEIKHKVGYDDDGGSGWVEEKPSKVQKIFQLSVTTLAFLAFGGYLLCMIVQAIKSKGTTYYHPALLPMVTASGGEAAGLNQISQISIRKRRPARLRRATAARQKRLHRNNAGTGAGPSPEDLYNVLVLAAEGYVRISAA